MERFVAGHAAGLCLLVGLLACAGWADFKVTTARLGNLYTRGESITVRLSGEAPARVTYVMENLYGESASGEARVEDGAFGLKFTKATKFGFIELRVTDPETGGTGMTRLGCIPPPRPARDVESSPFGMILGGPYAPDPAARAFLLHQLGVRWVILWIPIGDIAPGPGELHWPQELDRDLEALTRQGLKVVMKYNDVPAWLGRQPGDPRSGPRDVDEFAQIARAVGEHLDLYKGA